MSSGPLIAIVDDDESAREAVMSLVRALGFSVIGFASAAAFVEGVQRQRPACLIADVRMPGMGGVELHEELAASDGPVPTILMTAHPDDAARERALRAGVVAYLSKPLAPAGLLAAIRAAFAGSNPGPDTWRSS